MPTDATCLVCGTTGDRRNMDIIQRCSKCAAKRRQVPIERRLSEDQPEEQPAEYQTPE